MRRRIPLGLLMMGVSTWAIAQGATTGCNDDPGLHPKDASDELLLEDGGPLECAGNVPVMQFQDTDGKLKDGDWSCYADDAGFVAPLLLDAADDADGALLDLDAGDGSILDLDAGIMDATPPMQDAAMPPQMAKFQLTDFITLQPVGGASIDLFFGNDLSQPPDVSAKTAADGSFTFDLPANPGPLAAYRINAAQSEGTGSSALEQLVWLDNKSVGAGETFQGNSITNGSMKLLSTGIGADIVPGATVLTIGVRDCQYRDVQGGLVELIDEATGNPVATGTGPHDVHIAYFNLDKLPDPRCTHTVATPALWAAINVPANKTYRIRASGRMSASDAAPKVLGERRLVAIPDTIMIARPYRLSRK